MQTILGVDPGIATVGFGIIRSDKGRHELVRCGAILTPAGQRLSVRLQQIYYDTLELIKMFEPDAISIEELFFNDNLKTGISVAHGRGVVLLAGQEMNVPMFEYTPLQVKQAIAGYGRATKKQMMEMVRRLLNMDTVAKPDDASDALALAITHARFSSSLINFDGGNSPCSTI
ncbi:MAG: crossover junction endodeoxyribonuclease RuvC [Oscillospiraceae bacterium]|nr:crossover junction endodeoxyribonuclease RuvC [Oscillospiraceae bacterium]